MCLELWPFPPHVRAAVGAVSAQPCPFFTFYGDSAMTNPTNENLETSRRDFLKISSGVALSAGAVAQLSLSSGVFAAGDDVIKVGLVGCGGRGAGAAGPGFRTEGDVKMGAAGAAFGR